MANSNRAIIRKAAIETGSLSSGLLNPEQARKKLAPFLPVY